jgi:hypothetical protein
MMQSNQFKLFSRRVSKPQTKPSSLSSIIRFSNVCKMKMELRRSIAFLNWVRQQSDLIILKMLISEDNLFTEVGFWVNF